MNTKTKRCCCLPVCKGERFDLAHKFPRDPERVVLWLKSLDCPKLNGIPVAKLGYVCSRHFRVKDYKHPLSRSINKTAVPSLNLKDLSQLHLSKDSALSSQQDASVSELPVEETVFNKEHRKELSGLCHIYDGPSQECREERIDPLENFEDVHIEISDDILSEDNLLEDEILHEDNTKYSTFFQFSHPNYQHLISLNFFWLRCHCECCLCYDPIRRQRKISPMDIKKEVQPKSVKQVDGLDVLLIEWDDAHKSEYDVEFIFNLKTRKSRELLRKTWDSHSAVITEYIPIEFERLVSSNKECEAIFRSLGEFGVAVVSSIPAYGRSMAKLAICRLFPHLEAEAVHFREFNDTHSDISSNLTYSSVDCGLRCYFVTQETELILVDGLNVANNLKTSHADAFKTLSEVLVPLEISDCHVKCKLVAPVIEMDAKGQEISKLCLDVYKMGVLNTLPEEKVEDFYDSLRLMLMCVAEDVNHWCLKLSPGSMVLLDNTRILHKCSETPSIWEAHIQRKDYASRMRHLGVF